VIKVILFFASTKKVDFLIENGQNLFCPIILPLLIIHIPLIRADL